MPDIDNMQEAFKQLNQQDKLDEEIGFNLDFENKFGWAVDKELTLEEFDKFMQEVINYVG